MRTREDRIKEALFRTYRINQGKTRKELRHKGVLLNKEAHIGVSLRKVGRRLRPTYFPVYSWASARELLEQWSKLL